MHGRCQNMWEQRSNTTRRRRVVCLMFLLPFWRLPCVVRGHAHWQIESTGFLQDIVLTTFFNSWRHSCIYTLITNSSKPIKMWGLRCRVIKMLMWYLLSETVLWTDLHPVIWFLSYLSLVCSILYLHLLFLNRLCSRFCKNWLIIGNFNSWKASLFFLWFGLQIRRIPDWSRKTYWGSIKPSHDM